MCEHCQWLNTVIVKDRLRGKLDSDGKFRGRRLIHRDTPIDGGVYLGSGEREAIVVDSRKDPEIGRLYQRAKNKASEHGVLRAVYHAVAETMPKQDEGAVFDLIKRYGVEKDGKIGLGVFLAEGVGVCRHDALACGVTLEQFIRDGMIIGNASVDRSRSYGGSHAWTRFTYASGDVYVLDVAQGFVGTLEEARAQNRWHYERPVA